MRVRVDMMGVAASEEDAVRAPPSSSACTFPPQDKKGIAKRSRGLFSILGLRVIGTALPQVNKMRGGLVLICNCSWR